MVWTHCTRYTILHLFPAASLTVMNVFQLITFNGSEKNNSSSTDRTHKCQCFTVCQLNLQNLTHLGETCTQGCDRFTWYLQSHICWMMISRISSLQMQIWICCMFLSQPKFSNNCVKLPSRQECAFCLFRDGAYFSHSIASLISAMYRDNAFGCSIVEAKNPRDFGYAKNTQI